MPELVRSIAKRLREFVNNRRYATRHVTRLEVSVSPIAEKKGGNHNTTAVRLPALKGHTRDISKMGLALVVPAIHIGGQYLTGESRALLITLELPAGPIKLEGVPARYERLEENDAESGYLIGVHITSMPDSARTHFVEHIRTLKKG